MVLRMVTTSTRRAHSPAGAMRSSSLRPRRRPVALSRRGVRPAGSPWLPCRHRLQRLQPPQASAWSAERCERNRTRQLAL